VTVDLLICHAGVEWVGIGNEGAAKSFERFEFWSQGSSRELKRFGMGGCQGLVISALLEAFLVNTS